MNKMELYTECDSSIIVLLVSKIFVNTGNDAFG